MTIEIEFLRYFVSGVVIGLTRASCLAGPYGYKRTSFNTIPDSPTATNQAYLVKTTGNHCSSDMLSVYC